MRLIKSMRLTVSVRLIERTWALRAGPYLPRAFTNVKDRHAVESVIRGHHVYKTIWQPRLGPSSTLIPRELADSFCHFDRLRTFVWHMRLTNVL